MDNSLAIPHVDLVNKRIKTVDFSDKAEGLRSPA